MGLVPQLRHKVEAAVVEVAAEVPEVEVEAEEAAVEALEVVEAVKATA
jgi:hypothetical protein